MLEIRIVHTSRHHFRYVSTSIQVLIRALAGNFLSLLY